MTFLLPPGIKGLNKFKKIKAYIISITHTVQKIHAQSICLRLVLHYDNCRWNRSTETEFVWFPFTGVLNWCQFFVLLWVFYFVVSFFFYCDFSVSFCCECFILLWVFTFILLRVLFFLVTYFFCFAFFIFLWLFALVASVCFCF